MTVVTGGFGQRLSTSYRIYIPSSLNLRPADRMLVCFTWLERLL